MGTINQTTLMNGGRDLYLTIDDNPRAFEFPNTEYQLL